MMNRPGAALAALLFVVAAATPGAQQAPQPPQAPPQPVFRSGVETLPLDVTVVNGRGEPIRDLIATDFTVRLDGRPRRVLSAQWVPSASGATSATATPALPDGYVSNEQSTGGRLIVLVIDQPNIPFGEMRTMRDAVEAFIDRLSPADRVAVVGFGTGAKSTSFLSDHDQLKRALALLPGQQQQQQFSGGTHDLGLATALAIDRGDEITLSQVVMRDCTGTQRAILLCRQEIQAEALQVAGEARLDSDLTLRSLRDVLTNLRTVDAPKTLLLVSQGFLADNQRDDASRVTELGGLAAAARTSIYAFRLETNPTDVTRARGSLNPSLIAEDRRERRNGLEALTSAARGALFDIAGTGTSVFERVTAELSGYYLLGVEPDARDRDGKPHPIRIDVGRTGLTVRAHRTMTSGGDAAPGAAPARAAHAARSRDGGAQFAAAGRQPAASRHRVHVPRPRGRQGAPARARGHRLGLYGAPAPGGGLLRRRQRRQESRRSGVRSPAGAGGARHSVSCGVLGRRERGSRRLHGEARRRRRRSDR